MTVKRSVAAALVFGLGLVLGSCTSFSDFVSDHWPHVAGGEPDGVPPRPGAPGYNNFIAHGQAADGAPSAAGNAQPAPPGSEAATMGNPKPGATEQPAAAFTAPANQTPGVQLPPAIGRPPNDSNDVQGGLY